MKVVAGDFPKSASAFALRDRFVFGDKRKGEPVLYCDIERIEIDEETKKGFLVNVLFLDGRRLLALLSNDEFMLARAGAFEAVGDVDVRRMEATARTERVRAAMQAKQLQEKRVKRIAWGVTGAVVAFLVFKPGSDAPLSSDKASHAPIVSQAPRPNPMPAEAQPPIVRGVIADGAVEKMASKNYPKSYKKWGKAGFDRINGLAPKAAELIVASGTCDRLEVLSLSDQRSQPPKNIVFFGDCANGQRFYVGEADIKAGSKVISKNDVTAKYSDGAVVETCTNAVRASLKYPSSFDADFGGTSVQRAQTGNVVVSIDFEAKNALGALLSHKGRCVFDDQGMSPPEITNR